MEISALKNNGAKLKATIIFSYDCECLWGMLDHMETLRKEDFNKKNFEDVYKKLLGLHEKYNIPATFAIVGNLTQTQDEFNISLKNASKAHNVSRWLNCKKKYESSFHKADWFYPKLINLIKSYNVDHEIATQGFSHAVMNENFSKEDIDYEISEMRKWEKAKNLIIETIIFPRNVISQNFLDQADFINGYRRDPYNPFKLRFLKRAYSLLKEFIPLCKSEHHRIYKNKVEIPGGFFINWRSGLRRFAPIWLSKLRLRNALLHARKTSGVVHLWSHPHNLITGHKQFQLHEELLKYVSEFCKREQCEILTQKNFCKNILNNKNF